MRRFFLILLSLLLALPAAAQPLPGGRTNIAARLVAESEAPAAGQPVTIAFAFTPQPGWHGYWRNPGDAGVPARIEWQLPAGVEAGEPAYPVPERLLIAGLMNHVFEGPHALLVQLRLPQGLAAGTPLPIRARIDYLACTDEICVPERADLSLDLRVGDGSVTAERRAEFDGWRARLARPIGVEGSFSREGDRVRIALPYPASAALAEATFYPANQDFIAYAAPQSITRNGDMLVIETAPHSHFQMPDTLEGVIGLGEGRGLSFTARPGAVPEAGTQVVPVPAPRGAGEAPAGAAGEEGAGGLTLVWALLGAILGGIILNVMPCVFPILSLKALSLARSGETEAAARREAIAYAAGVIVTCLALGALLLALRAGGAMVGWAFQLQEPRFVLFLLLLVTAIALNLAGLFRMPGLSVEHGGRMGAFATGVLAAFVATPCTGPFMAAALGAALVLPAAGALAVFGGLGLGLALPFLLLGFVPALRRRLPRPGPWMVTLQRVLSVPMFVTALGLAWVLGRQTGADGMALGLAGALFVGLGLWWLGAGAQGVQRWVAAALVLIAAVGPMLSLRAEAPAPATASGPLSAEPFDEARLAALRAEGRPVFLYFTADWCITCKANERGALASAEVAAAFRARNVAVMVGDWTMGDAAIGRFLEQQGRSGVPLYLYYAPGREGEILPQVLTSAMVVERVG